MSAEGAPNVLTRIMGERHADALAARRGRSLRDLLVEAEGRVHHSLVDRLRSAETPRIIAETKKASPSAGLLREPYDPARIAREYAAAGAIGISVLTEPRHFLGTERDLRAVRAAVDLPVLRKDFVSDPYQLAEAAAWGADVVLLIVAGLAPDRCRLLYRESRELGLEAIVEVHTREELQVALACEGAIVGVNSRDLKTLKTDLAVARALAAEIPEGRVRIAESGLRTPADIAALEAAGYDGFLMGESLLKAPSPGAALATMRGRRWSPSRSAV
jgi:indole-3-glycerol phosphate synthase